MKEVGNICQPPGSILVMDNVRFHRNANNLELMTLSRFEYRYLTAYSPFLNPIKAMSRGVSAILLRKQVTPEHYQYYIGHCGANALAILAGECVFAN